MRTIFITGGHLTPALATIEELKKRGGWKIYFLGRKHAFEGDAAISNEFNILSSDNEVEFLSLTTGRLQSKITRRFFKSLAKIPIGFLQSLWWIIKYRPQVILSFGGYLGLPVSVVGWLLGVPVAIHEQTIISGRTNSLIQRFANKIFVSWKSSLPLFVEKKVVLTGNPIRTDTLKIVSTNLYKKYQESQGKKPLPTIWVTGGNAGSHSINVLVKEILPELLKKYYVIHQTGHSQEFSDFEDLQKINKKNYLVVDYLGPEEIGWVLKNSDLIIGRSGINTVVDLMVTGTPAVLIPLPWSARGEQQKNAKYYESLGAAKVLDQENLSSKELLLNIEDLFLNLKSYKQAAVKSKENLIDNAAQKIVDELYSLLD